MRVCMVGRIDNTPKNKEVLETYELKNDFWAERICFRRKDRVPMTSDEIKEMQKWCKDEIIDKHRTNWLSEKEPAYEEINYPDIIRKMFPWMDEEEIMVQCGLKPRQKLFESEPESYPKQLKLEFIEL